jgi:phosphoadenosine phosphosulfate reductase
MSAIDLYARETPGFADRVAASTSLLQRAARDYTPLTQASSLGVEDMVVTQLLHDAGVDCSIFVLGTGMLHPETVQLIDRLQDHYGRTVDVYRPDIAAAADYFGRNGPDAMYRSVDLRKQCCDIRKMEPLARALQGKAGWITGLRREQSAARAEVHAIEQQPERVKVNPLADWSMADIWHFVARKGIPYNPLHDQFFPSIGCAPCTRSVTLGEDPRSGRWWWEQESAKECGLHVSKGDAPASSIIPIHEVSA